MPRSSCSPGPFILEQLIFSLVFYALDTFEDDGSDCIECPSFWVWFEVSPGLDSGRKSAPWLDCCRGDAAFSASCCVGRDLSLPQCWRRSFVACLFHWSITASQYYVSLCCRHRQSAVSIHLPPLSWVSFLPPASRSSQSSESSALPRTAASR